MPQYDLGLLITLDIAMTLIGIFTAVIFSWIVIWQVATSTDHLSENSRRIAQIAERIDARLRRQFPDIDQDLQ